MENQQAFDWELTLPDYLKHEIDALAAVEKITPRPLDWDLYYNELQGSINSAQWGYEIFPAQA